MEESVFGVGSEGEAQAGGEEGTSAHPTTGCRERGRDCWREERVRIRHQAVSIHQ